MGLFSYPLPLEIFLSVLKLGGSGFCLNTSILRYATLNACPNALGSPWICVSSVGVALESPG